VGRSVRGQHRAGPLPLSMQVRRNRRSPRRACACAWKEQPHGACALARNRATRPIDARGRTVGSATRRQTTAAGHSGAEQRRTSPAQGLRPRRSKAGGRRRGGCARRGKDAVLMGADVLRRRLRRARSVVRPTGSARHELRARRGTERCRSRQAGADDVSGAAASRSLERCPRRGRSQPRRRVSCRAHHSRPAVALQARHLATPARLDDARRVASRRGRPTESPSDQRSPTS
jgi:hypothetical protein